MFSQIFYHLEENSAFFFFQVQVILEIGEKILEMERDYFQINCIFVLKYIMTQYVRKLPTVVNVIADL